jgi:hypothetical protein
VLPGQFAVIYITAVQNYSKVYRRDPESLVAVLGCCFDATCGGALVMQGVESVWDGYLSEYLGINETVI